MSHLIYGLFDPRKPEIIKYVGYTGYTVEFRLPQHIAEANYGKKNHRCNWIRSLLRDGVKPEARVIECVNEDNWQEREKYWIGEYAATVTNTTEGGEGLVNPSQEVRDRISKTLKESGCSIGNQYRKGIPHSAEDRKKISDGMRNSAKFKEAMINRPSRLGLKMSEDVKLKLRIPKTEEHRRKISEGRLNSAACKEANEKKKGIKLPTSSAKKLGSKFINDGKIVKQLKANEPLPDGWVYGMKLKQEKQNVQNNNYDPRRQSSIT